MPHMHVCVDHDYDAIDLCRQRNSCSDNESLVRLMNVPSLVSVCFPIKTGRVKTLPYLGSVRIRDDAPRTKKALANSPGPSHPFYGV